MNQLFTGISEIVNPIYGDMYILKDHLRSKTVSHSDVSTEHHPVTAWWWNGIPRKMGVGLLVGVPLKEKVRFKRQFITLDNGCALILPDEDDMHREITSRDVDVDKHLWRPRERDVLGVGKKNYPRIWPFQGPFSE